MIARHSGRWGEALRGRIVRGAGSLAGILLLGACALLPVGADIYDGMTTEDVTLAATSQQQALETLPDGHRLAWENPHSGYSGSFRPLQTHVSTDGRYCRDYEETISVGGRTGYFEHLACRGADGHWSWIAP